MDFGSPATVENTRRTRKDDCPHCQNPITLQTDDCIIRCQNCEKYVVFLCHILSISEKGNYQCQKCDSKYNLIKCQKCKYCIGIKNFQNGYEILCPNSKCEWEGVVLICPFCISFLCFPLTNQENHFINYERSVIQCKRKDCRKNFRYWVCKTCKYNVFTTNLDKNKDEKLFKCRNENCPQKGLYKESCWPKKQKRTMCSICKRKENINKKQCEHRFCESCYAKDKAITCEKCKISKLVV